MFTGIIEEVGTVEKTDPLTIICSSVVADASIGASIAVNGTCLTAVQLSKQHFVSDLSPETLRRTNLGDLAPGAPVNLERPVRFNGRLDGHFVLGHVDGTGEVLSLSDLGAGNWEYKVGIPNHLARYVVEKASIAVDGISLTVAHLDADVVNFAIIPHTYANTNIHARKAGDRVNVEVDILAKHLEKLVGAH